MTEGMMGTNYSISKDKKESQDKNEAHGAEVSETYKRSILYNF